MSTVRLVPDYQSLWSTMEVVPKWQTAVNLAAAHILQFKDRYVAVGKEVCDTVPVPWYFIGLIHHMESGQNFNRHLYNGDPLTARTVKAPPGRPLTGTPPFTWDFAATDALKYMGYGVAHTWDLFTNLLPRLEAYNGLGYQYHGVYSPYLWSGTNHYMAGRFEEVLNKETQHYDVVFNSQEVSQETGCAPILSILLKS